MAGESKAERRDRYRALLSNPHVRTQLDLIEASEGVQHGYNTLFGNDRFDSLDEHPNISKPFKQTNGRKRTTTAAGRYQFLKSTWDEAAKALDLPDFSPESQDMAALYLMERARALSDVAAGDFANAERKLGKVWASLPSSPYSQPNRSQQFIQDFLAERGYARPATGNVPDRPLTPEYVDHSLAQALGRPTLQRSSESDWDGDLLQALQSYLNPAQEAPYTLPEDRLVDGQRKYVFDDGDEDAGAGYPSVDYSAPTAATPEPADALQQLAGLVQPDGFVATQQAGDTAWRDQLMAQAMQDEDAQNRKQAVAAFFGEQPTPDIPFPKIFDDYINRMLETV